MMAHDRRECFIVILAIIVGLLAVLNMSGNFLVNAQSPDQGSNSLGQPELQDPSLRVQLVSKIPQFPTTMAFIGPDDILVLSKDNGEVLRIKDGRNLGTILKLNVTSKDEMGLLGIATSNKTGSTAPLVFILYTSCKSDSECNNFVYRYDWSEANGKMINPVLLLKLPGLPGPSHMGGKMLLGPDGFLYITLGDMTPSKLFDKIEKYKTKAQNYEEGVEVDGRAGILRITQDGKAVNGGILGNSYPANLYYAYGIKNSFGIGFDPETGYLWDTENGPNFGDEINLVVPGFNGGWAKIQGFWRVSETLEKMEPVDSTNPSGLVDFGGKGKYHQPKLVWESDAGPTAIVFLNSTKLGSKYQNDMFVGAVKNGRIFSFEMNENRSDLTYTLLSENTEPSVTFAQGFGIVTDLQVGPYDGYLYVVSGDRVNKVGALYRILPK